MDDLKACNLDQTEEDEKPTCVTIDLYGATEQCPLSQSEPNATLLNEPSTENEVLEETSSDIGFKFPRAECREPEPPKPILCPDHPLLEKFQQTLKEHLLRVKEQLTTEISEINFKINLKEKEREEKGVRLYDMHSEIHRQNQMLDAYAREICEITEKRECSEQCIVPLKCTYESKLEEIKASKQNYNQKLFELNNLQTLENNLQKWTKELVEDVAVAKRTVSKDAKLQQSIAEEKKQNDIIIFKLDTEKRKSEEELEGIQKQIKEQQDINSSLKSSVSDAAADLEALNTEHKKLTQAWGEVIVAIQHRDKVLYKVKQELETLKETYKLNCASIQSTRKLCAKENDIKDKLIAFKNRVEEDMKTSKRLTELKQEELDVLESKLNEIPLIIERTEKDLFDAKKDGNILANELRSLQLKIEKQALKNSTIEDEILKLTQEHLISDNASRYRAKLLRNSQEQRRNLELTLSQTENALSVILLNLEKSKGSSISYREENERLLVKYNLHNNETNEYAKQLKDIEDYINQKMIAIEKASTKLDVMQRKSDGSMSPMQIKTKEMELTIQETERHIHELQEFWLMLQGHIVNINEKRNIQINSIQLARKQLLISSQKALKMETELEEADKSGKNIARDLKALVSKQGLLTTKLYETNRLHEIEEIDCEISHGDLLEALKNKEMEILAYEQEINDLQDEIEIMKDDVLERHREVLAWETKYKMIEETIRWRRGERSMESEINAMKLEIRRMELRLHQLKRAQEKLIQDLDFCVMHREQIFITAAIRQKRAGVKSRSRSNVQQRLNDIRNKLKLLQNDFKISDKEYDDLNEEYEKIHGEITRAENDLQDEAKQLKLIQSEIEQSLLLKHLNLETIVKKQKRAKSYRALSTTQFQPKVSKSLATLECQLQRQQTMNLSLSDIIRTLNEEFPDKKFILTKIFQTLRDECEGI